MLEISLFLKQYIGRCVMTCVQTPDFKRVQVETALTKYLRFLEGEYNGRFCDAKKVSDWSQFYVPCTNSQLWLYKTENGKHVLRYCVMTDKNIVDDKGCVNERLIGDFVFNPEEGQFGEIIFTMNCSNGNCSYNLERLSNDQLTLLHGHLCGFVQAAAKRIHRYSLH